MVRVRLFTIGIVFAMLTVSGALGIRGIDAAPSAQVATPVPAPFTAGMLVQIKSSVPYAFLRSAASSNGDVVDTAHVSEFMIILSDTPRFDGVQWWWFVERGSGSLAGWVEQNSLQSALIPATSTPAATVPPPTTAIGTPLAATITAIPASPVPTLVGASAGWAVGTRLVLAASVPFAWVRGAATSNAYVRATVYPGYFWSFMTVRDATPAWDGTQYWWLVNVPALNVYGWVEQNSLLYAPLPPTAVPTLIPPTNFPTIVPTIMPTFTPTDQPILQMTPTASQ